MKLYKIDLLWIDENHGVDVGEIIICCIDDGEDGDEVGLWEKGGRSNLYCLREKLEGVLLLEIGDAR